MRSAVLDASALLAFLKREPGADQVEAYAGLCVISAVNLSEVLAKMQQFGVPDQEARQVVSDVSGPVIAFDAEQAVLAAGLLPQTRHVGLSLGDRACLALAQYLGVPAMTADRSWASCDLPIEIVLIR